MARGVSGKAVVKQVLAPRELRPKERDIPAQLSPCLANVPKTGPLQAYAKLVLKGKIREDKHQVKALHLLQKVWISKYVAEAPFAGRHRGDSLFSFRRPTNLRRIYSLQPSRGRPASNDHLNLLLAMTMNRNTGAPLVLLLACALQSCIGRWKGTSQRYLFESSTWVYGRRSLILWEAMAAAAAAAPTNRRRAGTPQKGYICMGGWARGRRS